MADFCAQGPTGLHFTLGGYEFRHYQRGQTHLRGKWEANKQGRGVSGALTPLDAWWRLRKWLNEPFLPANQPVERDHAAAPEIPGEPPQSTPSKEAHDGR